MTQTRTHINIGFRDTRKYRPELHGIRGFAIFLVVIFHIMGDGRVSGGIDVFLAVTGFLAIPSLYRRLGDGWTIDVAQRLATLIRRLFVPLLPVLIFVAVLAPIILPRSSLRQLTTELRASALFHENFALISAGQEYGAANSDTSVLQHLWSTGIQGQFHLVMIFAVMGSVWLALKCGRSRKKFIIAGLIATTFVSFVYAWWYTGVNQSVAYFSTATRAWELTLPGILGLVIQRFSLSPAVRAVASWLGFVMIGSTGFLLDGAQLFPGPAALWPVLGICLVLIGGETRTWWGADRLLGTKPFQWVGDISFSLYLWHWPLLVFATYLFPSSPYWNGILIGVLALSLVFGRLGKGLFEDGLANSRRLFPNTGTSLIRGVAMMIVSAVVFTGLHWSVVTAEDRAREERLGLIGSVDYPGVAAIAHDVNVPDLPPMPTESERISDASWAVVMDREEECIQSSTDPRLKTCQSERASEGSLVMMVGGSYLGQWGGPIQELGITHGWDLEIQQKAYCVLTTEQMRSGGEVDESCLEWSETALDQIIDRQPALVIMQGTTHRGAFAENSQSGIVNAVRRLTDEGIPVYLFRQTPRFTPETVECLESDAPDASCGITRPEAFGTADVSGFDPQMTRVFNSPDYFCTDEWCPWVIGNIYTSYDTSHISNTAAISALPYIEEQLEELVPELFN